MTEKLVKLEMIDPNPYQKRIASNREKVVSIAFSIASDKMLQTPTGRWVGKRFQSAIGHTRTESYRLNAQIQAALANGKHYPEDVTPEHIDAVKAAVANGRDFKTMPWVVEELTDEQMYRYATIENNQREDLSDIERMEELKGWLKFGYNSKQIAQMYPGMSAATVRGFLSLDNAPQEVKDLLHERKITQGTARKLRSLARVDPKQVKSAIDRIEGGTPADEAVQISLRDSDKAFTMWGSWNDGKPRAGSNLWFLDTPPEKFPMQYLPKLTAANTAKALDLEFDKEGLQQIASWIDAFVEQPEQLGGGHWYYDDGAHRIEGDVAEFLIEQGAPADQIEKIAQLINPPACTTCPFHTTADKQHYCGFKPCHDRKRKAWVEDEMQKLSKKLGIAIYDPTEDGKAFIPLAERSFEGNYQHHAKLFKDKDPDLRLQPNKDDYNTHKYTESHFVRVISVGKRAVQVKERKQAEVRSEQEREEARQRQNVLERALRDASDRFIDQQAVPQFAVVFKELTHIPAMCILTGTGMPKKNAKKADVLTDLRRRLASRALHNINGLDWRLREQGPVAVAKFLQKVAVTWGLKLPADFLETAKGLEPVSTETPKQKGKK